MAKSFQNIKICKLIFLLLFLVVPHTVFAKNWQTWANYLESEQPQEREKAREELKKNPQLTAQLKASFGKQDEALALTVIRELKIENMIPDLIESVKLQPNWPKCATLNVIINEKNRSSLTSIYRKFLKTNLDSATKAAMLDGLRSAPESLTEEDLTKLLQSTNFDVRIEAVKYAGFRLSQLKELHYGPFLEKAVQMKPVQVRLEAISWMKMASKLKVMDFAEVYKICSVDSSPTVKSRCKDLGELKHE